MRTRSSLRLITVLVTLCAATLPPVIRQQQSEAAAPAGQKGPAEDEPWPPPYTYIHDGHIPGAEKDVLAALPFARIELERTGCFGTCPAYVVTFDRDGQARYVGRPGRHDAPRKGNHIARIDPFTYGRLCFLLEQQGFSALKSEYSSSWTDHSTCYLRVWRDLSADPITVKDYGDYGPIHLWGLQQAVDSVAARMDWQPDPSAK